VSEGLFDAAAARNAICLAAQQQILKDFGSPLAGRKRAGAGLLRAYPMTP
jgi:hypothetical protein